MPHLPHSASDNELVEFIDKWAFLLELEDYITAYEFTSHGSQMRWTPKLIRMLIKEYGEFRPKQKVTVFGAATTLYSEKK